MRELVEEYAARRAIANGRSKPAVAAVGGSGSSLLKVRGGWAALRTKKRVAGAFGGRWLGEPPAGANAREAPPPAIF